MKKSSFSQSTIQTVLFQVCMQINTYNKEDTETGEQSKKKCNQEFCELKENVSSLKSCWNKFEKITSRWILVFSFKVALLGIFAFYMHSSSNSVYLYEHFMPEFWWKATVPCSWRWNIQKRLNQAAEVQEVEIKDQRLTQKMLQKAVSHFRGLETTLNFLIFQGSLWYHHMQEIYLHV